MPTEAYFAPLHGKLRSLVEWDVLQFFHHNPHTVEGAQHIATALGRDAESVQQALMAMTESGLLDALDQTARPLYRLTQDNALRTDIESFMRACDDPAFRRQAIERILAHSPLR